MFKIWNINSINGYLLNLTIRLIYLPEVESCISLKKNKVFLRSMLSSSLDPNASRHNEISSRSLFSTDRNNYEYVRHFVFRRIFAMWIWNAERDLDQMDPVRQWSLQTVMARKLIIWQLCIEKRIKSIIITGFHSLKDLRVILWKWLELKSTREQ